MYVFTNHVQSTKKIDSRIFFIFYIRNIHTNYTWKIKRSLFVNDFALSVNKCGRTLAKWIVSLVLVVDGLEWIIVRQYDRGCIYWSASTKLILTFNYSLRIVFCQRLGYNMFGYCRCVLYFHRYHANFFFW